MEARARSITQEMRLAAAEAIASLVSDDKLSADFIEHLLDLGMRDQNLISIDSHSLYCLSIANITKDSVSSVPCLSAMYFPRLAALVNPML